MPINVSPTITNKIITEPLLNQEFIEQSANIITINELDFTTSEPPHVDGHVYLNTNSGNGNISSGITFIEKYLYLSDGNSWHEIIPTEGKEFFNQTTNISKSFINGNWIIRPNDIITNYIDSSLSSINIELEPAVGSQRVSLYITTDLTNEVIITVPTGEILNNVIDGTFYVSNYSVGTQFIITDSGVGEWDIKVIGVGTTTNLESAFWSYTTTDLSFKTGGQEFNNNAAINYSTGVKLNLSLGSVKFDSNSLFDIANNNIIINKSGRYRIDFNAIGDDSGGNNSTYIQVALGDGTNALMLFTDDALTSRLGHPNGYYVGDLIAGQILDIRLFHISGENFAIRTANIYISEQPKQEIIFPGMVKAEKLYSVVYSLSADASGVICPFNEGNGDTDVITNNLGTLTLPKGKYRIVAHATRHNNILDYEIYDATNNITLQKHTNRGTTTLDAQGSTIPYYLTIDSPIQLQLREGDGVTNVVWNGREPGIDAGFNDSNLNYACYIDIQQLPTNSIVNPTSPINDQTSSGYFDIGNMRIQWGIVSDSNSDNDVLITLPALFSDSNYVINVTNRTPGQEWAVGARPNSTSQFYINRNDAATGVSDWNWQAIGNKP